MVKLEWYKYSNEQLIAIMETLDELMEFDEWVLEANPDLNYKPFKFHNRIFRSLAHDSLTLSYEEKKQYTYPALKKEKEK